MLNVRSRGTSLRITREKGCSHQPADTLGIPGMRDHETSSIWVTLKKKGRRGYCSSKGSIRGGEEMQGGKGRKKCKGQV